MCGIAGGWWNEEPRGLENRIYTALSALNRRGPDDHGHKCHRSQRGTLLLAHTRLSIIDLSSAGRQPMCSTDERLSIVFNGEIYNYLELRTELQAIGVQFRTNTDTEVLLAAWRHWGPSVLHRLKGMFAFVVFDSERQTLTCVRDAFGIKPLFIARDGDSFVFASELSALSAIRGGRQSLNWQTAYDYLVYGEYDSGASTFVSGAQSLLPGHLLEIDLQNINASQSQVWWQPSIAPRSDIAFVDAVDILRDQFLDSVRLHLRSDVPVGAALSGGIDSSAIVCAIRHVAPELPIHTFSYIAQGSEVSEEYWVDRVNGYVGATANKVTVTARELARDLEDLIVTQGEPFGSTSIYAQYRVFQLARERGVTVTLEGQGADEMMGGYNGYPGQRVRSLLEDNRYVDAFRFLHNWANWPGRSHTEGIKRVVGAWTAGWLHDALRGLNGTPSIPAWIRPGPLREAGVALRHPSISVPEAMRGRRMMGDLADSLTRRGLPALLRHGDRNSMRFSVESRVPFLLPDLADFMLSLPEDFLVSPHGQTKCIFRAAMRGIVPDEVLDRRDKIGFATPERDWLLGMTDTVRSWLACDLGLPFLNQAELRLQFERIVQGRQPFSWQVWRWVNFALWYRNLR